MAPRECSTQAEADAAAAAGDVIVWRSGELIARGSAVVDARGSSVVYASDSSVVHAYDSARVEARASVFVDAYDSARVTDALTNAPLTRARPRVVIGPLGSRNDTLGVSLPADGSEPVVYAGCWSGRLSDFAARVESVYPTGRYGDEYRATIAYIRAITAIPQEAA